MKRTILTLIIGLVALITPTQNWAAHSVVTHGDTMTIVNDNDTMHIVSKNLKNLGAQIANALDDTIINNAEIDSVLNADSTSDNYYNDWPNDRLLEMQNIWSRMAGRAITGMWFTLAFIIFICLLFSYLRRRRKYKVIEKAIDNNYPLPDGIFDGRPRTQTVFVQQPVPTPIPTQAPAPAPSANAWARPTTGAQATADNTQKAAQTEPFLAKGMPINWRAMWPAFRWIVVGLGMMLFFSIVEAWPMVGLFTIPVLIGLGKAFLLYQDQVYLFKTMPYNAPEQKEESEPATTAEQPTPPTPPVFNQPNDNNA